MCGAVHKPRSFAFICSLNVKMQRVQSRALSLQPEVLQDMDDHVSHESTASTNLVSINKCTLLDHMQETTHAVLRA